MNGGDIGLGFLLIVCLLGFVGLLIFIARLLGMTFTVPGTVNNLSFEWSAS